MSDINSNKNISRYILIGSFLGGLIGTTVAILAYPKSSDEKKKQIEELQKDFLKPVKIKFAEIVDHIGDVLKNSIDEIVQGANKNKNQM